MAKYRRSRLIQKEEKRNLRQAVLFTVFTILISLGLIFLGIPLLIRAAIFIGELRSTSIPVESKDTLPPTPPRLEPLPEATSSAQIELNGFSEGGTTIEVFLDNRMVKRVVSESDGSFQARNIGLNPGKNEIITKATDESGNTSVDSKKIVIIFDETPPELEIFEPEDSASFFGNENKVIIKGQSEEKTSVVVNNRIVIIDSQGQFSYPLTLSEGENKILVVATDSAGNQTEKEITISYAP